MAIETVDIIVTPEDGWVEVATNPTFLFVRPSSFHPWRLAIAAAAPSVNSTPATGTVVFSGLPTAADTVTINGVVYTFVAALVAAYDVLIGADATATGANLAAAINAGAGAGTTYGTGTVAHPDVSAAAVTGTVTLTSFVQNLSSNSITLAESAANTAVSGATLTGATLPVLGAPFGKDSERRLEEFRLDAALTGSVFVRIDTAPEDREGSGLRFAVIRST